MPSLTPLTVLLLNNFQAGQWSNRSPFLSPRGELPTLLGGLNIEVTRQFTLKKRPGFSFLAFAVATQARRAYHLFHADSHARHLLVDHTTELVDYNPSTYAGASIYSPVDTDNPLVFETVGDMLYLANGGASDTRKYDGTTVWKWGIDAPTTAPTFSISSNQKQPGTVAGTNWTGASNAIASDNVWATYSAATQDDLRLTNFGYSLPTGVTIEGIQVYIEGHATDAALANRQIRVGLTKDGTTLAGTRKTDVQLAQDTDAIALVGDVDDLWGTTWTKAEIESANFGVLISDDDTTIGGTIRIDAVRVRVTHSGGIVSTIGYEYRYCFKRSATGHISTASPASECTNSFNGVVTLEGARSTDPQVDKIEIYRTADGGGIFFRVDEIANPGSGTWTYVDNISDDNLGTLIAPLANLNDPPPAGLNNIVYFLGRMWGSVDNNVYYSGGGEIVNGVPEESWSPINVFAFGSKITAMTHSSLGVVVFDESHAYLIRGISVDSFFAMPWLAGLGVKQNGAVLIDSDVLYVFTSGKRLFAVDSSGQMQDIGFPVQDVLDTYDPTKVLLSIHLQEGALYVSNGTNGYMRYDLLLRAWSTQAATGFPFHQAVETAAADYRLLGGDEFGSLLSRNSTVFTDNGSAYPATAEFGSFVVSPPLTLVEFHGVVFEGRYSGEPVVQARLHEIGGGWTNLDDTQDEPVELAGRTTYRSLRYYPHAIAEARALRHLQLSVMFPAENKSAEILSLGIIFKPLVQ